MQIWLAISFMSWTSDYLSSGVFPLKCTPSTSCFLTRGFQTSSPKGRDVCEADMDDEPAFGAPKGAAATEVPPTALQEKNNSQAVVGLVKGCQTLLVVLQKISEQS